MVGILLECTYLQNIADRLASSALELLWCWDVASVRWDLAGVNTSVTFAGILFQPAEYLINLSLGSCFSKYDMPNQKYANIKKT